MEAGTAFVFDLLPLDALGRWPRPHDGDASRLNQEAVMWTGRFEKSRFQLAENDRLELLKWLNRAKTGSGEWPEWKLEVVGYADASGSAEHNEALSKLRAEHAKTVALATGMDPNRIVCEGKGSLGSFGASKSDRRVELRWVPLQ
jgi:outer membrane protein OmpA-like peptidoglycan-associated protein